MIFDLSDEALESIERHNTHLLWEIGKAPDFVLEIGSKSNCYRGSWTQAQPVR